MTDQNIIIFCVFFTFHPESLSQESFFEFENFFLFLLSKEKKPGKSINFLDTDVSVKRDKTNVIIKYGGGSSSSSKKLILQFHEKEDAKKWELRLSRSSKIRKLVCIFKFMY